MHTTPTTNQPRATRTLKLALMTRPEKVFPLLCPVLEYEWIETWACELVYSESGVAENDCVFRTAKPNGLVDTWVVSHYEPPFCIEFVITNALFATRMNLHLSEPASGHTQLDWTFTMTSLGNVSKAKLEQMATVRAAALQGREKEMAYYLATGQCLKQSTHAFCSASAHHNGRYPCHLPLGRL